MGDALSVPFIVSCSRLFQQQAFFSRPLCSDSRSQGPLSLSMDELERTLGTRMNCSKTSFFERLQNLWITTKFRFGSKKLDVCLYQIYGHLLNIKFSFFLFMNY